MNPKEKQKIRSKEWDEKNRERRREISRNYYYRNKDKVKARTKKYYKENKSKILTQKERISNYSKKYSQKLKYEIIEYYSYGSIECKCCREKEYDFLTLDHINGGGAKHRREVGVGIAYWLWLKRNNFPNGYQVLCMNCNLGRQKHNGVCPHKL